MIRQFYLMGEEVKRSMEWLIKRLIKVGARVAYHGKRWYVHVASAFPLARHYRAVFGLRARQKNRLTKGWAVKYAQNECRRHLFINVTTVLPLSGRVGQSSAPFRGRRTNPSTPRWCKKWAEWQDRRIIPVVKVICLAEQARTEQTTV